MSSFQYHSERSSSLQQQFYSQAQQNDASRFGMWIYLVMEWLVFAALIIAYLVMRHLYPHLFALASAKLDISYGVMTTLLLFSSSLTISFAVTAASSDKQRMILLNLTLTFILGLGYLIVKYYEFSHIKVIAVQPLNTSSNAFVHQDIFFNFFLILTSLHALFLLVGLLAVFWIYIKAQKKTYHSQYYNPVENVGLLWHLSTFIWLFLFPLLYLMK